MLSSSFASAISATRDSQKPVFELLGTPDDHKKNALYPGGHGLYELCTREIRGEVLAWLDRYLGSVRK